MIPALVGWTTEALPQGVLMTHPAGKQVATIAYRDRARPLLRLGAILADILSRTPRWSTQGIGQPERLVTHDGEHAALVTVRGTQDGAPAQRDLGFVFGDDFFSSVGGLCFVAAAHAELTSLVRDLTRWNMHYLGVRRRRFEYDPPPGWQPVPLPGLAVEWLAPEFPRDRTNLTVHAASPHAIVEGTSFDAVEAYLEQMGHRLTMRKTLKPFEVEGLQGAVEELHASPPEGGTSVRRVAMLRDKRYVYPLELFSARPLASEHPHWRVFQTVLESVRPIPPPTRAEAIGGLVTHWLE